eukprot:7876077-Pyramimonas_sp.AAC.1
MIVGLSGLAASECERADRESESGPLRLSRSERQGPRTRRSECEPGRERVWDCTPRDGAGGRKEKRGS